MKTGTATAAILAGWTAVCGWAQTSIQFDRTRYDITPGQTFAVSVLIDPVPASGVFSHGVRLRFPADHAQVAGVAAVSTPLALDFDGVRGAGAVKSTGNGFAAVKGTVAFSPGSTPPYTGSVLATFQITDLAPGPYTLSLDAFNTLGLTEQLFVTGDGQVLDSQITFGTALVNYRPSIRIVTPTNGATFLYAATIPVSTEATDLDGQVVRVDFFDGTNQIGQALSAPFNFAWSNSPVGVHELTAVATDDLGATATSSPVIVTVQPNSPPILAAIGDKTVDEGTLLTFTAQATDPDAPPQTLDFSLDPGAPAGASITPNGQFAWTPSEAQGPSTNAVTVRVTDNGVPPASDFETFMVTVREVNLPPILGRIGPRSVVVSNTLSFTATAVDPDLPPQHLLFSLSNSPPGAVIGPDSGVFSWTPTFAPDTAQVTVRITDDGLPALSDEETFDITVLAPTNPIIPVAIFGGAERLPVGSKVVNWNGNNNQVIGRLHSNSDIDVSGNKHVFRDGVVEHVTGIRPSDDLGDKVTLERCKIVKGEVEPYPVDYRLADFAPGGTYAVAAAAEGKYYHIVGDTSLAEYQTQNSLREGLYYVEGRVHLSGAKLNGKVTIVATDSIKFSTKDAALMAYTRCLLAFSGLSTRYGKTAIDFSGSAIKWQGVVFAPDGGIDVSGANNTVLLGSLIGKGVRVTGSGFYITGIDPAVCTPLVLPLTPVLASTGRATKSVGSTVLLQFSTIAGVAYVVESSDVLSGGTWAPVTVIVGDGSIQTVSVPVSVPQRFYRLRMQ